MQEFHKGQVFIFDILLSFNFCFGSGKITGFENRNFGERNIFFTVTLTCSSERGNFFLEICVPNYRPVKRQIIA
jgi:hypothetical protein